MTECGWKDKDLKVFIFKNKEKLDISVIYLQFLALKMNNNSFSSSLTFLVIIFYNNSRSIVFLIFIWNYDSKNRNIFQECQMPRIYILFFFSKAYGCFTRDEEKMQHHFCSLNATKIFGVYGAEIALMGVEFLICVITSYQICISKCGGSIRGL